jgi:hypothetical protein
MIEVVRAVWRDQVSLPVLHRLASHHTIAWFLFRVRWQLLEPTLTPGYPDLLKAYLEFRQILKKNNDKALGGGAQLIIMGHGSVDDPDGTMI